MVMRMCTYIRSVTGIRYYWEIMWVICLFKVASILCVHNFYGVYEIANYQEKSIKEKGRTFGVTINTSTISRADVRWIL